MTTRTWRAAIGVAGGGAAVAASVATSWGFNSTTNPVLAVASMVRDHTPGWIAVPLIHLVGHLDKPLLVATTFVFLLALAGGIGVLAGTHWTRAVVLVFVVSGVGIWAVAQQPHVDMPSVASGFVGLVAWLAVLSWLGAKAPKETTDFDRRGVLRGLVVVVALSAVAVGGAEWLTRGQRAVQHARKLLRLPVTAGSPPADADMGTPGALPWRTASADFYRIDTSLTPPAIDPSEWRLRIHGMVDREITLTYDDLLQRKFTEAWVTLCCVSNPVGGELIGNAFWSGVRVADLLAEAGVHPDADAVRQTSYDSWDCGTPLAALTDGRNAMLAVAMNGEPLPIEHGFPVRTVVPGLYGYVSATKWVVDLEVTRFDRFQAYWTQRGWSAQGPVKTQSRIVVPTDGGHVPAGSTPIAGVAWAQHTGVAAVEVSIDGGPWRKAELGGVPDDDTWVQWRVMADLKAGGHHVAVRATDKSGHTQTSVQTDVVPNGATGWHTIGFTAS